MTRNAMPQFDSFDPEVLEAARDVAARAGVPLETWIASVVPQKAGLGDPGHRRPRRRYGPEPIARHDVAEASRPDVRSERPPAFQDGQAHARSDGRVPPAAASDAPALAAVMSRLDGLDRSLEEERRAAQDAESRRLEEIEARIQRALATGPAKLVTERLGDIERRVSQLGEQFAAARPPGRRGRPAAAEIRDAVQDIRQRQRELSEGSAASAWGDGSIVANMHLDLARRLEARTEDAGIAAGALSELQRETARLHAAVDRLATGRDVAALEQAVVALADGVERARAGTDLTAIAAPIEQVRAQVVRMGEDQTGPAHGRVADDVRRLAGRLDAAVGHEGIDKHALSALFDALDAIRRRVGALAGPERVAGLAPRLQAIGAQVRNSATAAGPHPLPDGIRVDLTGAGPAALAEQVNALAAWIERPEQAGAPRDTGMSADMASIHALLRNLAEKVDRVGNRSEGEGLDALEKQVLTLAGRLEAPRGGDPALAGLGRTLDDLLAQVAALRESAPSEAVVERAARNAVAQTLQGSGVAAADPGEIGLLRASLADMQARQIASDQRLGTTLEGVQSALDRLVSRLGPALDDRLMASTSPEAVQAHGGLRPGAQRDAVRDVSRLADGLLEPGAARPPREAAARRTPRERSVEAPREPARARSEPEGGSEGDIKTSFIAAARRAAQAAQAELAAEAPADRRDLHDLRARKAAPAPTTEGPIARLRAEIDRRRRPLLLGLAAIVLALGALQAISMRPADEAPRPAPVVQAPPVVAQPRDEASKEAPKDVAKEASKEASRETAKDVARDVAKEAPKPAVPDPQTTQSLPSPVPASAKPAVPVATGMNTLTADLGNLPPGLAKVKQAALDGDGSAIWELAMREADGRGMPRDLSVAAKLYDKLAAAGYAPAQYKLAGHYEKGSGVVRDLDKAKLWYGRAAEQGHARSMHNLAVLYAENPGVGGKPDFASAASWFRQGAEYGIRDSQYNLAVLYARGLGLTQDLVQSYAWFAAAAAQGDDDAAKKRDDVANKLNPGDLASAKSLAAGFKARKPEAAVNEPPAPKEPVTAPMSLLGAPSPSATAFTPPARKAI